MKKLALLTLIGASLFFTSCDETGCLSEPDVAFTESFTKHFNAAIYIYKQTDIAMRDADLNSQGTATIDGAMCTLTGDSLIIDWGTVPVACSDGKNRVGSIRIGINATSYLQNGFIGNARLKGYKEDDQAYGGEVDVRNVTTTPVTPEFTVEVVSLDVDSLSLTTSVMQTTWDAGFTTPDLNDDAYKFEGSATLENTNNSETFMGTINEPLLIRNDCIYSFVSGKLSLLPSDTEKYPSVEVDFIDSDDCNNLMLVDVDCEGTVISVPVNF